MAFETLNESVANFPSLVETSMDVKNRTIIFQSIIINGENTLGFNVLLIWLLSILKHQMQEILGFLW